MIRLNKNLPLYSSISSPSENKICSSVTYTQYTKNNISTYLLYLLSLDRD